MSEFNDLSDDDKDNDKDDELYRKRGSWIRGPSLLFAEKKRSRKKKTIRKKPPPGMK